MASVTRYHEYLWSFVQPWLGERAMEEFEEGYRYKPLPLFLYNVAQSAMKANHPQKALELFRRYLVVSPKASERVEVQKAYSDLEHV